MRVTQKFLLKKLCVLCTLLGDRRWGLDYAPLYGGYVIVKRMENGGENLPLLSRRLTASEMSAALDMALSVMGFKKQMQLEKEKQNEKERERDDQ